MVERVGDVVGVAVLAERDHVELRSVEVEAVVPALDTALHARPVEDRWFVPGHLLDPPVLEAAGLVDETYRVVVADPVFTHRLERGERRVRLAHGRRVELEARLLPDALQLAGSDRLRGDGGRLVGRRVVGRPRLQVAVKSLADGGLRACAFVMVERGEANEGDAVVLIPTGRMKEVTALASVRSP